MQVVTISAAHGAGGSVVGPQVAERLGVPFLDRAIPARVAQEMGMSAEEATAYEAGQGLWARLLAGFASVGTFAAGPPLDHPAVTERDYLAGVEAAIQDLAAGGGVILGRAAAVFLEGKPGTYHVRLDGPEGRRAQRLVERQGIDEDTARQQIRQVDQAREQYVRHFYRADARDPRYYHLLIDTTVLTLETCVEVVAKAVNGMEPPRR